MKKFLVDKYPPEVSNPDFEGLNKASYSNVVKVFESKFHKCRIIFW